MNLDKGCKNICIDNNGKEDEEDEDKAQIEDEKEDADVIDEGKNEEDDEPDFMDNSGKCWEFAIKIGDEKHLKEWCQNKMGGMIVGKEEKLTRQFHCQIKQCQFKAIFLKSCSIIYTRNKHNHEMENAKDIGRRKEEIVKSPSSALARDYNDKFGKSWAFHAHIGKNITREKLLTKFGFSCITKKQKTLYLNCRKSNSDDGVCPFVGIYLKSNGCLYTRGEHKHTKRGKTPQNIGQDYMDKFGKIWKFNKVIGKNVKREMLHNKFGFANIITTAKGLNLHCGKRTSNAKCKFAGIYLNSNGCLYTRGKHNHTHLQKQATAEANHQIAKTHALELYTKLMEENLEEPKARNETELVELSKQCENITIEHFMEAKKLGEAKLTEEFLRTLRQQIKQMYKQLVIVYRSKVAKIESERREREMKEEMNKMIQKIDSLRNDSEANRVEIAKMTKELELTKAETAKAMAEAKRTKIELENAQAELNREKNGFWTKLANTIGEIIIGGVNKLIRKLSTGF